MKTADTGALSDERLVHKEMEGERALLDLTFRLRTGQLEDTSKLSRTRKDIARLRTAQRQREIAQGLPKDALRNRHRSSWRPAESAEVPEKPKSSAGFLKGLVDKIKGSE